MRKIQICPLRYQLPSSLTPHHHPECPIPTATARPLAATARSPETRPCSGHAPIATNARPTHARQPSCALRRRGLSRHSFRARRRSRSSSSSPRSTRPTSVRCTRRPSAQRSADALATHSFHAMKPAADGVAAGVSADAIVAAHARAWLARLNGVFGHDAHCAQQDFQAAAGLRCVSSRQQCAAARRHRLAALELKVSACVLDTTPTSTCICVI